MLEPSPAMLRLRESIPELGTVLDKEIRSWEEATGGAPPTDDYVFATILAPFTAKLLREDGGQTGTVKKIFSFLEQRLASASEWDRNLVEVSFCEQFVEERDVLQRAIEEMGPCLRRSIEILRT